MSQRDAWLEQVTEKYAHGMKIKEKIKNKNMHTGKVALSDSCAIVQFLPCDYFYFSFLIFFLPYSSKRLVKCQKTQQVAL
jgi:hypothetical protein